MANTGVKGRIVFAGSDTGIEGVTVSAVDLDPLISDEHLGTATTDDGGNFNITYTPFAYRTWLGTRNPFIEVRVYGDGQRLLWAHPRQDNVEVDVLDIGTISIHRNNFRVPESASAEEKKNDRSWLVTHTSLDPANGLPVRLSDGNEVEWLVDGAELFPDITKAITEARRSIKFMNLAFAVDNLFSKFEFPFPKNHKTVEESDIVNVHRLERIMAQKADTLPVHVLSWDLENSGSLLGVRLFDDVDLADEVREYFQNTNVVTDTLETSQLLHIKMVVVDGQTAFVIGSTMKQGYFNDQEHAIRDARHGGRQLMHDVHVRVKGPAVRYVDQTFTTIWNAGRSGLPVVPAEQLPEANTPVSVQVLRTLPGELFTSETPGPDTEHLPHGETGILEAYQRAIMKAEEFIYIEDQYFTSPEIVTAIKLRMAEKPDLEVILVLNVKPDIPGYQKKQTAFIKELRRSLGRRRNRLGVFTVWSNDPNQSNYEIAHVYVHAKLAIIDDKWATVGTANLDGASLNQRQWGLILAGVFDQLTPLKKVLVTLLAPLIVALSAVASVPMILLALAARGSPSLSAFILDSIRKEVAGTTQHANPHRERQPPRHPELNLVVYNDVGGQKPTDAIKTLRESLWTEMLGAPPPDTRPEGGWVKHWRLAACNHRRKVRAGSVGDPTTGATPIKILRWLPYDDPERYLEALGVVTFRIDVRDSGEEMLFNIHDEQEDPNEEPEEP
jgi:phosphatidylserine/phosphatidylglycerophosphate/cardiolipin synthase-like enzyme